MELRRVSNNSKNDKRATLGGLSENKYEILRDLIIELTYVFYVPNT